MKALLFFFGVFFILLGFGFGTCFIVGPRAVDALLWFVWNVVPIIAKLVFAMAFVVFGFRLILMGFDE